jgi:ABC-2 type transport system ATP-binding protein
MELQVQNLVKVYGTQRAVDGISFTARPGEVLGFLGPNGAGKSTTMKIITCFLPATEGNVQVGAFNVREHSLEVRRQIGYLPEHNPLYLDMYVQEFLRFVGRLQGLGGKELRQRVVEVIEQTGLGPEQHKKLGMLSKGYRQRAGIAQALLHNPGVLILDEPTSGLDPNQVVEIRKLIQQLGREKTVIFSSHILSEVEAIAQRVVIIHKGRILKDSPIQELRSQHAGQTTLMVEFEKPDFRFERLFQSVPGLSLQPESQTRFVLIAPAEVELRKLINEESIRQENYILTMNMAQSNLEDIFRQLTSQAQ